MKTQLEHNLSHSHAAYLFAVRSLPDPNKVISWPITRCGLTFMKREHIESMRIEFGWSFFCRYEACVEAFLKDQNVQLTKKLTLEDWLSARCTIPSERLDPIRNYRRIRNALHHDDGASFDGPPDTEIHLLPQHMEKFYEFFVWLGETVVRLAEPSKQC